MSSLYGSGRLKVLKQLARTEGEKSRTALEREAGKIAAALEQETDFDTLNEQLTLLDTFAFRVPDTALSACRHFLKRLETLELTHGLDGYWSEEYETNARLISETLEVISRIRYFKVSEVLETLLSQTMSGHEDVRKKASEALHALAEYNIDVVFAGKGRGGLGISPQKEILAYLESLSTDDRLRNFDALVKLAGDLLSPNVTGTSWDYRSVTWQSGALTPTTGVVELRLRTLGLLESFYDFAPDVSRKLSVISAMMEATRMPNRGKFGDDVAQMVSDNTVHVLSFLAEILPSQPLPVMQQIEHDAYWRFYHAPTEAVSQAALRIRSLLESFPEYAIYRDLIGFQSIFHPWEGDRESQTDYAAIERYRSARALEYADSVDDGSWTQWRSRIIEFSRTKSDDLATFPKFYEFLERFAKQRPDLALILLRENLNDVRDFVIPLLRGIWGTSKRAELRSQVFDWIERDQLLTPITKLFIKSDDIDHDILHKVLAKQLAANDMYGLVQFVSVAVSNHESHPDLASSVMLPAIEAMSAQNNASWVHELWFRPELGAVVKGLSGKERERFVECLLNAPNIDFHEEAILVPIAEDDPERIIRFFGHRIERENAGLGGRDYQAVPYSFHQLQKVLEKSSGIAIGVARSWFDLDRPLFQYREAKLLSNIFPGFPDYFARKLIAMTRTGSIKDIEFVLAVLRSYDGEDFLHDVCRAVVDALPADHPSLSEVYAVIYTTGMTSGEYGIADAYDAKAKNLSAWLDDSSDKVKRFAKEAIASLTKASSDERRRADEEIELRKHKFGVAGKKAATENDSTSDE
ncbi:hypothetical protein ABMA32_18475 [Mesorhizobium sp. VNQ89]|uniref:hypothetical protein n=1 Tax=Mesorhizobium quangtriensis TaxID=3157709 RepID=UPI0032B7B05A